MRNIFRLGSPLLCLLLVPSQPRAEESPFKIGVIASLSGSAQSYGVAMKNGIEMALKEHPSAPIQVIYEDDQFVPSKSVAAFRRLSEIEKVDLVITCGSTPSNAVAPLAQAKGLPLIAWASDRKVSLNRPLVLRSYPSGETEGEAAAKEARRLGYKNIALLTSSNDYTQSWRNGVVGALAKDLIEFDEEFPASIDDFKPFLLKARSASVTDFLLCVDPGKGGLLAKQAKELSIQARIGGCQYLEDSAELEVSGGALSGAWFTTIPVEPKFKERVIREIGSDSVLSGVTVNYDVMNLLVKLLANGRPRNLISTLTKSGPQVGVVGKYAMRKINGDRFMDIPLEIHIVPGG